MTARARRTTTLVGPNRLVLAGATGALVALASAGTVLLVLTGTSSVAPVAAPAPPLPSSSPLARAPGVVVLPSDVPAGSDRAAEPPARHGAPVAVVPVALAFTEDPPVTAAVARPLPARRRTPEAAVADTDTRPGRHLAKGHHKHGRHVQVHGKRIGWAHSEHFGNR